MSNIGLMQHIYEINRFTSGKGVDIVQLFYSSVRIICRLLLEDYGRFSRATEGTIQQMLQKFVKAWSSGKTGASSRTTLR